MVGARGGRAKGLSICDIRPSAGHDSSWWLLCKRTAWWGRTDHSPPCFRFGKEGLDSNRKKIYSLA